MVVERMPEAPAHLRTRRKHASRKSRLAAVPVCILMAVAATAPWELNGESTTPTEGADASVSANETQPGTELALTSYNVCAELCPDKGTWPSRAPLVAQQIAAVNPDVVTTQETGDRRDASLLADELERFGFQEVANEAARYIFINPEKVSVARTGAVQAQRTPDSRRQEFPLAHLRTDSGAFTFVGVHQSPFDSKALDKDRASEAAAVAKATSREDAVVLMGDFNGLDRPHQAGYEADFHRTRSGRLLRQRGFTPRAGGNTIVKSATDRRRLPQLPFDRIYTRGDALSVKDFTVSDDVGLSDHHMITATIVCRDRGGTQSVLSDSSPRTSAMSGPSSNRGPRRSPGPRSSLRTIEP